jgi:lipoprotein signal peptidase
MNWHLTMLAVDAVTLFAAVMLLRKSPCMFQTMAMSFIVVGFTVYVSADIADIFQANWHWMVREVADRFVKLGIIVYLWRMFIDYKTNQGRIATKGDEGWTNSSQRYRRLLG